MAAANSDFPAFRAAIVKVSANLETDDRFLTLRIPKSNAGVLAQMSLYGGIVFAVKMEPESLPGEPEL
jgi:hypothetical protein